MNSLYILLIINLFKLLTSLHLSNYQLALINSLVKNPTLQNKEREKINLILYKAYEKWAIKKAVDFKTLHKYKCKNIRADELTLASKIGLFKSIIKYNGNYNLINYSSIYVNSELLKLLTEKHSLSLLPKSYRIKNKSKFTKTERMRYNFLLNAKLSSQYEDWQIDLIFANNEDILHKIINKNDRDDEVNDLFRKLPPMSKRILYLKYYLIVNTVLSNKNISKLMCFSEETIRKQLLEIKQTGDIL